MPRTPTSPLRRRLNALLARLDRVLRPYRPELHYMRGPGPKWHARHQAVAAVRRLK
jgi:hypothetical protein